MSLHDIWRGDVMPLSGVAVSIGRNTYDPPAPVVPVFDIHARTLVLHDSASSGILYYHDQGAEFGGRVELIASNSGAQSIVTAIMFDAYDATGGTTVTTSATTLNIDTVNINTHPAIFSLSGDVLHISQSGTYSFEYAVSLDNATATRTSSQANLQLQPPGGAFADIGGSYSYGYHRQAANGEDTLNCKIIYEVLAESNVRLSSLVLAGSNLTQVADSSRLTVRKLK